MKLRVLNEMSVTTGVIAAPVGFAYPKKKKKKNKNKIIEYNMIPCSIYPQWKDISDKNTI